jgi:hypothetical protein
VFIHERVVAPSCAQPARADLVGLDARRRHGLLAGWKPHRRPIRVSSTVGEGRFLQSIFFPAKAGKGSATVTHQQNLCDFPSEEEIEREILQVGMIDLSRFIGIYRIELVETLITAKEGDFDFLTGISVRFVPKPGAGDPVELGSASDPNGLGSDIELVPPADVDFLELIRANDASDSVLCPKLEFDLTFSRPPLQDIKYRVDVTIDGFVEVRRMS